MRSDQDRGGRRYGRDRWGYWRWLNAACVRFGLTGGVRRAGAEMSNKPLGRAYDAADHTIIPRAQVALRTGKFAGVAALATRTRATMPAQLGALSDGLRNLVSLSSGRDVPQLRRQIGALDHEVHRLNPQLAEGDRPTEGVAGRAAVAEPDRRP